jgi:hypothetical protein
VPHYIFLAFRVFVPLCLLFIFSCSFSPGDEEPLAGQQSVNNSEKRDLKISESLSKKLDSDALISSSGFKVAVKLKPKASLASVLKSPSVLKTKSYGEPILVNAFFAELTKAEILELAQTIISN